MAPVAAEPPHNLRYNHQVVPMEHVKKEDVMEAPSYDQNDFKHYFHHQMQQQQQPIDRPNVGHAYVNHQPQQQQVYHQVCTIQSQYFMC